MNAAQLEQYREIAKRSGYSSAQGGAAGKVVLELIAEVERLQAQLAAVPVDAIRKMRFDAEVELHGYTNAELDAWLDAEQDAANAAAELRAPTYNGGCW